MINKNYNYVIGAIVKYHTQRRIIIGLGITHMGHTLHMNNMKYLIIPKGQGVAKGGGGGITSQRAGINMV